MQIAVIGSGNVGATLGSRWAAAGHEVLFGARDPHSPKAVAALAKAGDNARIVDIPSAIAASTVVVIAVPGRAVPEFAAEHGSALAGKLVIDATNQFDQPVINGLPALRAVAPTATFIRAFNSQGWETFADPIFAGVQADLFYCAPEGEAREVAEQLIADVGFRPILAGDLSRIALVDNLGALWVNLAFAQQRGRRVTLKLLG